MKYQTKFIVICALLMARCTAPLVEAPPFDGQRAFDYLKAQVELGPRVPGTVAWQRAQAYYFDHFRSVGMKVDSQPTTFLDPYSRIEKPMVNVLARAKGVDSTALPILFVAHYDCRPRTDRHSDPARAGDSLPGANDGASGPAVMMELANMFASKPPACDVEFLLVDAEDWGIEGDPGHYLLGSKYFATQGIHGKYRFGIVIDLIGDKGLEIFREGYSEQFNKQLNDMVWSTAKRLQLPGFQDMVRHTVLDDHLPINAGGVPAILLIDFDYPHWHTEKDLPENCSAESLAQVGRLLAEIAYNKSLWP